jgi:hypothetical protein
MVFFDYAKISINPAAARVLDDAIARIKKRNIDDK